MKTLQRMIGVVASIALLLMLMPFSAFTASAAGSPVVNIPDTTGTGLSSADPIIVDTFAELKAAMEYNGTAYVRVDSMHTGLDENLPAPSSSSDNAITMIGTKYLELDCYVRYHSVESTKYNAFMLVNGDLTVSGEGGMAYSHNSRYGDGAVFVMNSADASLKIAGSVTISGNLDSDKYSSDNWAFGRAVVATGGNLTINGGDFYCNVYDGPGVQSYQHRSAVYLGRSVKATINSGEFRGMRIYTASSPMDSHPVGITLAPDATKNIQLCGGTYYGMYITGAEKALNQFLLQGYYFYDLDTDARFVGDKKESPYDDYATSSDQYHRITLIDVAQGVLNFGILTPTPTSAELKAHKTDLGTLYIGTNQVNKTFSATAARLPDRELAAGFTPKLRTEVLRNGDVIYSAENGDSINLSTFIKDNSYVGTYQVRYTLGMWDVLTETSRYSETHTYTMQVKNEPIDTVRVNIIEPRPGQTIEEVSLLTRKVDRVNAVWYEIGEGGSLSQINSNTPFKNNTSYRVVVTAYAKDIYDFDAYTTATLNSVSATVEYVDAETIRFYRDYNTGNGIFVNIAVTTPPTKTAYKEGDTLQVEGMVVTGYFSNNYSRELTLGSEYVIVESSKMAEGQTYITVSATFDGVTKTATTPVTVTPANYAFTFLEEAPLSFALPVGETPTAKTLTVKNIGDQKLGASDIALSGANPEAFVLSRDQLWSMFATGSNSQRDFTVAPAENLAAGEYTATLTVTNADAEISISMELILNVYDPITISGTVTSFNNDSDIVTIGLYKEGDFTYAYQDTPIGNTVTFAFEDIVPDDYLLEVTKKGHKTYTVSLGSVTEDTVVDVTLEPTVPVSAVELELYGYELAAPLNAFGLYTDTDGVEIGGYLVTDASNSVVNNTFAAANTTYWISVQLNPADGYHFDELMISECTLNGETPVNSSVEADGLWLTFPLPALEAVTLESIELFTEPYAVGDDFNMLEVVSGTDGIYVAEEEVVDDSMSILEGAFAYNTPYLFEVIFVAADGCEMAFTDMSLITLDDVPAIALYDIGEGAYVAIFAMPELKVQHEVTFMIGDSPVATQPVNEGEAAVEPEEPYQEGYKFTGWYTEDGDLYDFSTPVNAPIVLVGHFVEACVVTLMFDESPVGWITVERGTPVERPEDPGREGYVFVGWVTPDGELYDFDEPVYSDISLIAKFEVAFLLGDVNLDGTVNSRDALRLYQHTSNRKLLTDPAALAVADVDGSGGVYMRDALALFQQVSSR